MTNWFETLLVQVWYPTTVCTNSRYQKLIIANYLDETADSLDGLPFKLHDFGYRGSSSVESAGIGDAAHLVNFVGTDTIAGLQLCRKYYRCPMAGFSIPAAEHSTITTWTRQGEMQAFRNMLQKYPTGLVSVVSDSYDIFNAVENIWGKELRDLVLQRDGRGCLVVRPDSGEPKEIVVQVLELLSKNFPCTTNKKGYKVLPSYLRVIQGDGISYETVGEILDSMKNAGWSAENVVFGTGGALLQKLDRDTQKFAFKCSSVTVNGAEVDVFKQPITDPGKNSKKGRLTLEIRDGIHTTVEENKGSPENDLLITVYENGRITKEYSLDEIRDRAEIDFVRSRKNNPEQNNSAE